MRERWKQIELFPDYSVSNFGFIRSDKTDRILSLTETQWGLLNVGLMRDGVQYHRSVPLLVANAFLPRDNEAFDTPINLDGNRHNNHINNLVWRPRWFAIKYNQQFKSDSRLFEDSIITPIIDLKTGEISDNSYLCAQRYGLLERELVFAILNRTFVWPTYQTFGLM